MNDAPSLPASPPRAAWVRLSLGLLLLPALAALSMQALPHVRLDTEVGDLVAFCGATGGALFALAVCATATLPRVAALCVAAFAAGTLGVLSFGRAPSGITLITVNGCLVALAWALGGSLGRRVQHETHLFPACVVAASADVVSLLSPEGPSNAVASSERALSVLAIWFPVPGSTAVSPALGVGDLLFIAFVLGVARAHRLSYSRAVGCCASGLALAGFAAACSSAAVPALVPIAAAIIAGLPSIRRLRVADRKAAHASMLLAATVAAASIARASFAE